MILRLFAAVLGLAAASQALAQGAEAKDNIAGPYVPTPWVIVDEMLKLADIRADDVVYDLGSGDGRLVITAAKRYRARGVGIELQPELVELARAGAKKEDVADRVKFEQGDLFETDIRRGDALPPAAVRDPARAAVSFGAAPRHAHRVARLSAAALEAGQGAVDGRP
jgi:predicted RNA methylase